MRARIFGTFAVLGTAVLGVASLLTVHTDTSTVFGVGAVIFACTCGALGLIWEAI